VSHISQEELDIIFRFDLLVLTGGFEGWFQNRGYTQLYEFIQILDKRNLPIDTEVYRILINAQIMLLDILRNGRTCDKDPEENEVSKKQKLEELKNQYEKVASVFMNSYGLTDYNTRCKAMSDQYTK